MLPAGHFKTCTAGQVRLPASAPKGRTRKKRLGFISKSTVLSLLYICDLMAMSAAMLAVSATLY